MNLITSKHIFILMALLNILLQWSCNMQPAELGIPNTNYNIPVNFIKPILSEAPLVSKFYNINYEAEYSGASGKQKSFIIKNYKDKVLKVRYSEFSNETLIMIKNFMPADSGRACFIRWHNVARIINKDGVIVTITDKIPGIGIDETTEMLETNIDSLVIKKMYPKLCCKIKYKNYKEIIFDCTKSVPDLDFFKNIKFVE